MFPNLSPCVPYLLYRFLSALWGECRKYGLVTNVYMIRWGGYALDLLQSLSARRVHRAKSL